MKKIDLETAKKIDSGFKIPEDYFETFESRLFDRLAQENETVKPVQVITLWQRKTVWISGIAAAVAIVMGTWFYVGQTQNKDTFTPQDYLAYSSEITTEDIAKHLTDEDITALEGELSTFDAQSEKYINDYLN